MLASHSTSLPEIFELVIFNPFVARKETLIFFFLLPILESITSILSFAPNSIFDLESNISIDYIVY